jgi:transcriptional regulator
MRTTLNLDDDLLRAARSLARQRGESIGTVVSRLLREALAPEANLAYEMDVPVFVVREGAAPITSEMVEAAGEES